MRSGRCPTRTVRGFCGTEWDSGSPYSDENRSPALAVSLPLRICWLHRGRDRALCAHVVFGDELGIAASDGAIKWFQASPVVARRGVHTLMLRYENEHEAFGFCLPASIETAAEIERARKLAKPTNAARKWGPLLGKFRYLVEEAAPRFEQAVLEAKPFTHVRRPAHPDPTIDRFLQRERAAVERDLGKPEKTSDNRIGRRI